MTVIASEFCVAQIQNFSDFYHCGNASVKVTQVPHASALVQLGVTSVHVVAIDKYADLINCSVNINVVDRTPPYFAMTTVPKTLKGNTGLMRSFTILANKCDACDPAATYHIVNVIVVEDNVELSAGSDWVIVSDTVVSLRNTAISALGRTYIIVALVTDSAGNQMQFPAYVTVRP